jgi:hypothetical protein
MNKTEKQFKKDFESSLPDCKDNFESLSAKVDWEQYRKPKRRWLSRPWVLAGSVSALCACLALAIALPLTLTKHQTAQQDVLAVGVYAYRTGYGDYGPLSQKNGDTFVVSSQSPASASSSLVVFPKGDGVFDGYGYFSGGSLSGATASEVTSSPNDYRFRLSAPSWTAAVEMVVTSSEGKATLAFSLTGDAPFIHCTFVYAF